MSSFSLGRYVPYNSFIHKLDPRTKIFCFILLVVPIFLGYSTYSLTFFMAGLSLFLCLTLFFLCKMSPLKLLKSLMSLWLVIIFLSLIYAVYPRSDHLDWVAFYIGTFPIYWASILDMLKILIRLMMMVALSLVLTASTKPLDLTYGLEWYLTPLKFIGVKIGIWAMIVSLALRFIPTILEDVQRIMKAQSSRGVDFKHGKITTRVRAMVSLIIPLFANEIMRSDELADAMECRGYDPRGERTRLQKLTFTYRDLIATLVVTGFCALALYLSISGFDPFLTWWGLNVR